MKAEIIAVGTELLLGHTVNTDAAHVARALSGLGADLHHACVVGDNAARLEECLRAALQRSDWVITTGGLGPTNDDLTKETVARVLGLPLEEDADSLRRLREYFGDRPVGENQYKQAWLPRGSRAFVNRVGTAPGGAAPAAGDRLVIMLPGPPSELLPMLHDEVVPWLAQRTGACIRSSMVRTFALGEGDAELRLRMEDLRNRFVEEATSEAGKLENEIIQTRERIRPLRDAKKRLQVKAPVSGKVVDLKVHSRGGVVRPGEPLMDIVPHDTPLIVETQVPINKITEVYIGQDALVQLDAFDTRIIPHIPAKVTYISADRLEDRTASGTMPYYLCYVVIDPQALKDAKLYLSPGMPATVFITTKKRTVLYYMFEPLIKSWDRSLRE